MTSVPFSIRLPSALVDVVNMVAKKTGMSTPDAMRAAIELSVRGNEYRLLVIEALKQPSVVLQKVRAHIQRQQRLAAQDYSALLYFFHAAYMSPEGFANPTYVAELLELARDLYNELNKFGGNYKDDHIRSNWQITSEETIDEGVTRICRTFRDNPSVTWAEYLTRPLEAMADDLQFLTPSTLPQLFDKRLERLLAVAVLGAKQSTDGDIVDWDLKALLPQAEQIRLQGMSLTLYSNPIGLVFEEGHHCYAFSSESVMSFVTAIENKVFDGMISPAVPRLGLTRNFRRGTLDITRLDNVFVIHESGGYRLQVSIVEFTTIIDELSAQFSKPAWGWLVKRYRDLRGDY